MPSCIPPLQSWPVSIEQNSAKKYRLLLKWTCTLHPRLRVQLLRSPTGVSLHSHIQPLGARLLHTSLHTPPPQPSYQGFLVNYWQSSWVENTWVSHPYAVEGQLKEEALIQPFTWNASSTQPKALIKPTRAMNTAPGKPLAVVNALCVRTAEG